MSRSVPALAGLSLLGALCLLGCDSEQAPATQTAPTKKSAEPRPVPAPSPQHELSQTRTIPFGEGVNFIELSHAQASDVEKNGRVDILGTFPIRPQPQRMDYPPATDAAAEDTADSKDPTSDEPKAFVTITLLQNVTVFQKVCDETTCSVGLLLTQEESQLINLARYKEYASLHLLRRQSGDVSFDLLEKTVIKEALADLEVTQKMRSRRHRSRKRHPNARTKPRFHRDPRARLCLTEPGFYPKIKMHKDEKAFTIEVPWSREVLAAAKPDDLVDIHGTFHITSLHDHRGFVFGENLFSVNMLNAVQILGVHGRTPEDGPPRLTIAVTPEEARLLLIAMTQPGSHMSFALRNYGDFLGKDRTFKYTLRDALEDIEVIQSYRTRRRRRPQKKRAEPSSIQIFRGNGSSGSVKRKAKRKPVPRRSKSGSHQDFITLSGSDQDTPSPSSRGANEIALQAHAPEETVPPSAPPTKTDAPAPKTYTDTHVDNRSTFALDVDTGSYTLTRRALREERLPDAEDIRPEEFLNYPRYGYPNPTGGEDLGVMLEVTQDPFVRPEEHDQHHILRVGVKARDLTPEERKPVHLTFLLDVSGSMDEPDRLTWALDAIRTVLEQLHEGDTVSLVTFSEQARVRFARATKDEYEGVESALSAIRTEGSTNLEAGMTTAYDLARRGMKGTEDDVHRVIVMSDGLANVGAEDPDGILTTIRDHVDRGITMSTIGFGDLGYNDYMMEQLADNGDGHYTYVDDPAEIGRVFGRHLDGALQVMAREARAQVVFDPDKVASYELIGYDNRAIADADFHDDSKDAGELGAGHEATALYALTLKEGADLGGAATVKLRYVRRDGASRALETTITKAHLSDLAYASDAHRAALGIMAWVEILRNSERGQFLSFDAYASFFDPNALVQDEAHPGLGQILELYRLTQSFLGCPTP